MSKHLVFMLILPIVYALSIPFTMAQETRPNIVLIFADDMGYGDVSALNPEARTATPHIDQLAHQGIIFTRAHASASVCTPSRYGLLTGRYAFRSEAAAYGINGFDQPVIEAGRETLASLLQKAGYTTACVGKWHLGLGWQTKEDSGKARLDTATGFSNIDYRAPVRTGPNNFGFDESFIHPASLDMPPYVFLRNHQTVDPEVVLTSEFYPERLDDTQYAWDKKHTGAHDVYWEKGVWWRRGEISRTFRVEHCLSQILDEGLAFMERQVGEKSPAPFFLYLPLTGPHTPWVPAESFKGKSPIGTYGDFMMQVDEVVGQVNDILKRLGIQENTILIFSSDNGAYWPQQEIALQHHEANWGRRGQKGDVWDGGHRVPLIISWPSQIKGAQRYDHLVSLTDLFATLAELTGQPLQQNSGEDSFSFLPVLKGNTSHQTRSSMIHHSANGMYSLRMDGWKWIDGLGSGGFTAPSQREAVPGGPSGQLYFIENDSLETTNTFLQQPEVVRRLQKEFNSQKEKGQTR